MWSTLEVAKLIVGLLAPISIGIVGYLLNRRIRDFERIEWSNRKAVEKRLEIFDAVAPDLNRLYCYLTWVGDWQSTRPDEVIAIKRRLDKTFFVYRYLLGEEVFCAYQDFIALCFRTYARANSNALIRTPLASELGDRRSGQYFAWQAEWDGTFDQENMATPDAVRFAYESLMQAFMRSVGL